MADAGKKKGLFLAKPCSLNSIQNLGRASHGREDVADSTEPAGLSLPLTLRNIDNDTVKDTISRVSHSIHCLGCYLPTGELDGRRVYHHGAADYNTPYPSTG